MKTRLATILILFCLCISVNAQNYKIGYVNVEKVFAEWPDVKSANTELQQYETQLQGRLQSKVKDFQTKLANYNKNVESMDAATRQDTETELQNLQTQIQQFESNAQQSVAEKNLSLLQPLQEKLKNTIDTIGKENGYTHIFSLNSALVFTTDTSGDISPLVAQRLGFTLSRQ